jgi:hypothetical protein
MNDNYTTTTEPKDAKNTARPKMIAPELKINVQKYVSV